MSDEEMAVLTISDKTVKVTTLEEFEAYNKNNEEIGYLCYVSTDPSDHSGNISGAIWVYVDKDVTINGQDKNIDEEYNEEYIADLNYNLKKGWNICETFRSACA